MDRIQVSRADIDNPDRLRDIVDRLFSHSHDLLTKHEALRTEVKELRAKLSTAGVSADDRTLLKQLAIGGTASAAPAQNALFRPVDVLPPTATAIDGEAVWIKSTNVKYLFNAATQAWVAW